MRIGIVALDSRLGVSGGLDIYVRGLVEALAANGNGHAYTIFTYADKSEHWKFRDWPEHIRFAAIEPLHAPQSLITRGWRRLQRSLDIAASKESGDDYLSKQIDALGLDLLHYPRTILYPSAVRTPCVLSFFDMQHEYYPEFFTDEQIQHRNALFRPSVNRAVHIAAPSAYTKATLMEKYGVDSGKVTVIPVGLSEDFVRADHDAVDEIRNRYNLPQTYVFYPANPWPHKNHARLMAALRILRERYGQKPALILSGRLEQAPINLRWLAIAADIVDQVIDLGFVAYADLPALYSGAVCMVFPSLFEGFGIPLVEAMACGCPIVAAKSSSIPECVQDAALLFDPLDPSALADGLYRLLHDDDLRTQLIKRGYRRSLNYGWQNIVPKLVEIYEHAIPCPPGEL